VLVARSNCFDEQTPTQTQLDVAGDRRKRQPLRSPLSGFSPEALASVFNGNNYVPSEVAVKILLQAVGALEQSMISAALLSNRQSTIIELVAMA